nr:Spi family protease inhibitor [Bacteroidales bacterium]
MKRFVSSIILVAALLGTALAKPVDSATAAAAARNFWSAMVDTKTAATLLDRSAEWNYADLRLYTSPAGGFVIVAADDEVRPILAYSPTGTFDPANLPPAVEYWLLTYQQQIDWMRDNDGQPYPDVAERWQSLLAGNPGFKDGTDVE